MRQREDVLRFEITCQADLTIGHPIRFLPVKRV
jgi:hypothetical protein